MRRSALIAGMILMYILACALPVRSSGPFSNGPGINCLAIAFVFFPVGLLVPFWWANPLFFGGCLALGAGKNGLAGCLGLIASLLAVAYNGMAGFGGMREGSALWMIAMFWLTLAGFGLTDVREEVAKPGAMDELRTISTGHFADHDASSAVGGSSSASSSSVPLSSRSPS